MTISKEELEKIMEKKSGMRREAYDRRAAQENKDEVSAKACERFMELPEYKSAQVIMWYIDCRSETRTKPHLIKEVEKGERKELLFLIVLKMKMVTINLGYGI